MQDTGWRLTDTEMRAWLDRLRTEGHRVVAPVERDGLRLFRAVKSAACVPVIVTRGSPVRANALPVLVFRIVYVRVTVSPATSAPANSV